MPLPYVHALMTGTRRYHPLLRATWLPAACLTIYYAASASRDLSLYDSGELALAAVQLGVGHPPGQPLHTLLGHIASRITGAAPLLGVNLMSALPAGLSLVPATRISLALSQTPERSARWVPWLLLLFALHESMWEPAARVEVYTLSTLWALCAIAYALPLLRADCDKAALLRRTGVVAVCLGLSASSNPVIAATAGLALAPGLLYTAVRERAVLATSGRALLGGALGLLPYLYLPLAAARSQVMVWGGLDDADSFVRYLSLRDYAHNQTLGWGGMLAHAGAWGAWSLEHLLMPVLWLGLGGFVAARAQLRFVVGLFVIAFSALLAMISFNFVWDLQVPDYNGYLGLAYWLAAAGAAALFAVCVRQGRHVACAVIVLCLAAALVAPPAPWARTRSQDRLARALGEHVLQEAPPGAILISLDDYFAGTLFYLQEAEKQRRDVVVLAFGLSGSSWHWRHLQMLHPGLHPIDLQQRGSREQRIRRWLEANAHRPVLVERLFLAQLLQLRACPGGLYLRTGALCDEPVPPLVRPEQLLAEQLAQLGQGSPSAAGAIAKISEKLGSALWRLGATEQAHAVLLAGVPRGAWPARLADAHKLAGAPPWMAPLPHWTRHVALGDPARNLFLAGAIAAASGQPRAAHGYVAAAANLRLPEAQALLARPQ